MRVIKYLITKDNLLYKFEEYNIESDSYCIKWRLSLLAGIINDRWESPNHFADVIQENTLYQNIHVESLEEVLKELHMTPVYEDLPKAMKEALDKISIKSMAEDIARVMELRNHRN